MSWTLTTSGAILAHAGLKANISQGNLATYSDQAEGYINAATRKDWVADYSSVGTNFKSFLSDTAAQYAAMQVIKFDPSGFTSRGEAELILDVLRDNFVRNVEILKDEKNKEKMVT